jgi:hypothetical protein
LSGRNTASRRSAPPSAHAAGLQFLWSSGWVGRRPTQRSSWTLAGGAQPSSRILRFVHRSEDRSTQQREHQRAEAIKMYSSREADRYCDVYAGLRCSARPFTWPLGMRGTDDGEVREREKDALASCSSEYQYLDIKNSRGTEVRQKCRSLLPRCTSTSDTPLGGLPARRPRQNRSIRR